MIRGEINMDNELFEKIINDIAELRTEIDDKKAKKLNLVLLERVVKRVNSFSEGCEECKKYLIELNNHIENIINNHKNSEKIDFKEYRHKMNITISHLQKEHKLVPENYYMGAFMSVGISIGFIFGLLLFDTQSMGISIGLVMGLAIGSAKDSDCKKKGITI